eukprot:TRINITY_DN22674_c1_g3_i1.p1 TRINITY_DN22674_c1_g3~~TRINITY_DN22674_c1_g3_i1.p1  ORF type:complete len:222 (-),score=-2.38 TRINITY_DN22674_c1_g3_i1:335-1000(-)
MSISIFLHLVYICFLTFGCLQLQFTKYCAILLLAVKYTNSNQYFLELLVTSRNNMSVKATGLLKRYFDYPTQRIVQGVVTGSQTQAVGHVEGNSTTGYWQHKEQQALPRMEPDHIQQLVQEQQDPIFVDLRGKYNPDGKGQIEGAINASMKQICMEPHKLLNDKEQPYVLYCDTGIRAKIAGMALRNRGFTNVGYLVYNEFVRTSSPSFLIQAKGPMKTSR